MRKFLVALTACTLLSVGSARANLIDNGDFSSGTGSNFTSWIEAFVVNNQGHSAGLGWSEASVVGLITQAFQVTTAALYTFKFDVDVRANSLPGLAVTITDGSLPPLVTQLFNSAGFKSFTAYLGVGSYDLSFLGGNVAIDNVSVAAVPAPIAAAGIPGVLALAGFLAWRRKRMTPSA